jgi:hypothetical protein
MQSVQFFGPTGSARQEHAQLLPVGQALPRETLRNYLQVPKAKR